MTVATREVIRQVVHEYCLARTLIPRDDVTMARIPGEQSAFEKRATKRSLNTSPKLNSSTTASECFRDQIPPQGKLSGSYAT